MQFWLRSSGTSTFCLKLDFAVVAVGGLEHVLAAKGTWNGCSVLLNLSDHLAPKFPLANQCAMNAWQVLLSYHLKTQPMSRCGVQLVTLSVPFLWSQFCVTYRLNTKVGMIILPTNVFFVGTFSTIRSREYTETSLPVAWCSWPRCTTLMWMVKVIVVMSCWTGPIFIFAGFARPLGGHLRSEVFPSLSSTVLHGMRSLGWTVRGLILHTCWLGCILCSLGFKTHRWRMKIRLFWNTWWMQLTQPEPYKGSATPTTYGWTKFAVANCTKKCMHLLAITMLVLFLRCTSMALLVLVWNLSTTWSAMRNLMYWRYYKTEMLPSSQICSCSDVKWMKT